MESGDERRGSWQEEEHLLYEGVSNGPIQFKSARKNLAFARIAPSQIAFSCSQNTCSNARILESGSI